ncbi:MAG: hypothetical protein KatS3mg057_2599 [Herpetosiphonaceae bacterium]|nr:MAG: hypothetical protein KatS3mg057_2599 [Herpetosiphonaceae bacterium]
MYKAAGLSDRFQMDPQMQLPQRPRFSEDYLLIDLGEAGLLVQGAEKPELFRGKAARVLLPRLLPLLDGTRTVEDLQAALPQVKPSIIADTISLLFLRGLLEEGITAEDERLFSDEERSRYQQQLLFFGRYTDVSRVSHNRYGTQGRLKLTNLLLIVEGAAGPGIAAELAKAGIGQLSILPAKADQIGLYNEIAGLNPFCSVQVLDPALILEQEVERYSFVVAVGHSDDPERWGRLAHACRQQGVSWLRAIYQPQRVEIGPIFSADEGACYQCFLSQVPAAERSRRAASLATEASAAYIALTIVMEISRLFSTALINKVRRFDLDSFTLDEQPILRLPRCGACGSATNARETLRLPDDLALLFHLETNHKWEAVALKGHQIHYSAQVSNLTMGAYKEYWTFPKVALPPLEELPPVTAELGAVLAGWRPAAPERITVEHLSQICGLSARWREPGTLPYRFTPSGGGLCSAEIYVIVWDVEGLDPGIYHYDGARHRLERLREGDQRPHLRNLIAAEELIDRSVMAVVQTGHFYRLSSKYGPRAYRYVHLDAGVMTQSLRLLANALGLRAWNLGQFADGGLAELLRIPPIQELPTQVVLISR